MDLFERTPDRPPAGQDPLAVIALARKDAARRSAGYEVVFDEIAKTLGLLSNHRLLKDDVQFQGLVAAMIGVENPDLLHDRVLALVAYVDRVAQAHGAAPSTASSGSSNTIVMQQRPSSLADPDDPLSQRTRLQVR